MFFICRDEGVGNNASPVLGENRSDKDSMKYTGRD